MTFMFTPRYYGRVAAEVQEQADRLNKKLCILYKKPNRYRITPNHQVALYLVRSGWRFMDTCTPSGEKMDGGADDAAD